MILDTNALSALLVGDEKLAQRLGRVSRLHLPVIVLGEYRFGLLNSRSRRPLERLLQELEREALVLSIDFDTIRPYAQIRDELRQAGKPLPQNDTWIAALALQHELPIVSRDAHFDFVRKVRRLAW